MLGSYKYLFLDTTYLKIRHNDTVIDQAMLIAYGVNNDGNREILGVSTSLSEAEVHWREFPESLVKRGLNGLELIISDDHFGLRSARKKIFLRFRGKDVNFTCLKMLKAMLLKKA